MFIVKRIKCILEYILKACTCTNPFKTHINQNGERCVVSSQMSVKQMYSLYFYIMIYVCTLCASTYRFMLKEILFFPKNILFKIHVLYSQFSFRFIFQIGNGIEKKYV